MTDRTIPNQYTFGKIHTSKVLPIICLLLPWKEANRGRHARLVDLSLCSDDDIEDLVLFSYHDQDPLVRAHLMFNVKHALEMRDVMSIVNHYMFYGTRNPTRKLTLLLSSSTRCLGGGRPHLGQAISRFAETRTIHFATTLTSPWATLQRQNPPCP